MSARSRARRARRSARKPSAGSACKSGDAVIVFGPFDQQPERYVREGATADALEAAGLKVTRMPSPTDGRPIPTSPFRSSPLPWPTIRTSRRSSIPAASCSATPRSTCRPPARSPGDVVNIGFDTSPQIVEGFKDGWVQLTADQQPFLQGYMPILSLCQQVVYGLAPINVDTGAGFVTPDNYEAVADLATEGLR